MNAVEVAARYFGSTYDSFWEALDYTHAWKFPTCLCPYPPGTFLRFFGNLLNLLLLPAEPGGGGRSMMDHKVHLTRAQILLGAVTRKHVLEWLTREESETA